MKIIFKYLGLALIITTLISCDSGLFSKGVVIDKKTGLPIDSVIINVKNIDTVYTDSKGKYKVDTTIYGHVVDLEILVSKQGYKTKHVNFKKDKIKKNNAIIEMEILENSTEESCFDLKRVSQMYFFNKYFISLINILTLLFLIFKKRVKWRIIWILGVFIFNFTIFISFVDCSLMDFKPINGPVFLTHYWHYPFSIKIVFPIASIAFWSAYLINKRLLLKPEEIATHNV
jgi:hypothetical protein